MTDSVINSIDNDKIISTSHHIVSVNKENTIVTKTPRVSTPTALAEIRKDHNHLKLLGYDVRLDDRNNLIMPFIGRPLTSITEEMPRIIELIKTLQTSVLQLSNKNIDEIHSHSSRQEKIGDAFYRVNNQKIKERLPDNDYGINERVGSSLTKAANILNQRTASVITHSDTRAANFLKDDNNKIHLIDWESAVPGLPDLDLASLHSYLFKETAEKVITTEKAKQSYISQIRPHIQDKEAYDSFLALKTARRISWAYVFKNFDEAEDAIKLVNRIMEKY